jgi:DNA-binding Lrp family transcriptional regulator
MIEAYVLAEVRVGMASLAAHRFEDLEKVVHADTVTGCYDILARVRTESPEDLQPLVEEMGAVDGVTRILLCPVSHQAIAAHRGWQPLHAPV